jgi:hypothetical protein
VQEQHPRVLGPSWQAPPTHASGVSIELHPNLARVAVEYQRVCERYARREIDETAANREIRNLIARDDEGVAWTVNPRDGGWVYWSVRGEWVGGEPPRAGVASLSAYDFRGPGEVDANPDREIRFQVVGDNGDLLAGSTRREAAQERPVQGVRFLYPVIAAVLVCALAIGTLLFFQRGETEVGLLEAPSVPAGP